MSRPTSRLFAAVAAVGLLASLAACGKDDPKKATDSTSPSPTGSSSASGDPSATGSASASASAAAMADGTVAGITVSGKVGDAPTVKWDGSGVTQADPVRQVLVKGDGAAIESGDKVFLQIWIGNGKTKKEAFSSYTQNALAVTVDPTQTLALLADGLEGQTIGSRIEVAQNAAGAFANPEGNTQMGLGKDDTAVFVIDVIGAMLSEPTGATKTPALWAPKITDTGGIPTGLDFTGTPEPTGKFNRTTLIQGTGATLAKGDHVYVNYLGAVYGADKPFDQSYSRGVPFDFDLGGGGVIKGWDQGLAGVKVGSRVILQIPPSWGYGDSGQPQVGIKGTDTLYFVVDVLGAA